MAPLFKTGNATAVTITAKHARRHQQDFQKQINMIFNCFYGKRFIHENDKSELILPGTDADTRCLMLNHCVPDRSLFVTL